MISLGLLAKNDEMIDSFSLNLESYDLHFYKSIESIKNEQLGVLFVDISYISETDDSQFFLSKIRKKINNIPVYLISQTHDLKKINPEWFFKDFIVYPFRKGELLLRVKLLFNKTKAFDSENHIQIGKLLINKKEYSVFLDDKRIDFTYKEFELLCYLVENKGKVFAREELLQKIWGLEYIGGTRTVDVHIRRLRSKLGIEFNSIIETIRNVGYRCIE